MNYRTEYVQNNTKGPSSYQAIENEENTQGVLMNTICTCYNVYRIL